MNGGIVLTAVRRPAGRPARRAEFEREFFNGERVGVAAIERSPAGTCDPIVNAIIGICLASIWPARVSSEPEGDIHHRGPLAQLAEQQTLNLRVVGSIPTRLTTLDNIRNWRIHGAA